MGSLQQVARKLVALQDHGIDVAALQADLAKARTLYASQQEDAWSESD